MEKIVKMVAISKEGWQLEFYFTSRLKAHKYGVEHDYNYLLTEIDVL